MAGDSSPAQLDTSSPNFPWCHVAGRPCQLRPPLPEGDEGDVQGGGAAALAPLPRRPLRRQGRSLARLRVCTPGRRHRANYPRVQVRHPPVSPAISHISRDLSMLTILAYRYARMRASCLPRFRPSPLSSPLAPSSPNFPWWQVRGYAHDGLRPRPPAAASGPRRRDGPNPSPPVLTYMDTMI